MSAIFGVFRFDGTEVTSREIGRMSATLAHRGPDGRHLAVRGPIGMGHALMRVNREDWHEAQPIEDGDVMLAADIRIDNREEIAAAAGIPDEALAELSDSAVLLAAYRLWGDDLARHVQGDFTFAIWNGVSRTLLLGRDRMGQRGLYYHLGDGFIAFASEARALWAIDSVPRRLSQAYIARRLMPQTDPVPHQTPFERIDNLSGGTVLRIDAGGTPVETRYWAPHADPAHLGHNDDYYFQAYRDVMGEAVACRVRRLLRRPSMLLSGGFDSGAIAVLAGPIVQEQGRTIFCVSSVLEEGGSRPGIGNARDQVEAYRDYPFLDIHYHLRHSDGFDNLEAQFAATHSSNITIQRQLLAVAATSGARLVLDGYGGDYTVHVRAHAMLGRFLRHGDINRFLRECVARRRATRRTWRRILLADILPAFLPVGLPGWIIALRAGEKPWRRFRALASDFARTAKAPKASGPGSFTQAGIRAYDRWRGRWLEIQWRMVLGEPWSHTQAAAYGLDHSRPFHDSRVVELALAVPERLQFTNGLERHLPRVALGDRLPKRVRAVGPGNNQIDPDQFRFTMAALPALIARARAEDRDGRLSQYVDFDAIERTVAGLDEHTRYDRHRATVAMQTTTLALFMAWFDKRND